MARVGVGRLSGVFPPIKATLLLIISGTDTDITNKMKTKMPLRAGLDYNGRIFGRLGPGVLGRGAFWTGNERPKSAEIQKRRVRAPLA